MECWLIDPRSEVISFVVTGDNVDKDAPLPDIYIASDEGSVFHVPTLPEEKMIEWSAADDPFFTREGCVIPGTDEYVYSVHGIIASFRDGKVVHFSIDRHSPLRIAASKDGPFSPLPLNKEKMVELFGEPKAWRTARSTGVR